MRPGTSVRFVGPPGWRRIPPVTRAILVATAAGYLATLFLDISILVLAPAEVLFGQVWRLVTYPFVNVRVLTLLFDLLLLWSFGSEMEPRWGSRRFTAFLLLATALAGVVGVLAARPVRFEVFLRRVFAVVLEQRVRERPQHRLGELPADHLESAERIADVDDLVMIILHQIDAGLHRQIFEDRLDMVRGL